MVEICERKLRNNIKLWELVVENDRLQSEVDRLNRILGAVIKEVNENNDKIENEIKES